MLENWNIVSILIKINKNYIPITKTKCKDVYWHLINLNTDIPNCITKWHTIYNKLKYKIIYSTISSNKWLYNIKLKTRLNAIFVMKMMTCNISFSFAIIHIHFGTILTTGGTTRQILN
jgi:hypothetical protein